MNTLLAQEQSLNALVKAARGQTTNTKAANAMILKSRSIGYPIKNQPKSKLLRVKNAFNQTLTAFAITPLILAFAFVMHIFAGL